MTQQNLLIVDLIIALVAASLAVYASITLLKLRKLKTMFGSSEHPENLEEIIQAIAGKIKGLESGAAGTINQLAELENTLAFAIQKVTLSRYNAFADLGGNLSFTLALLNAQNSGVLVTVINGRDQNRVYAKNITSGQSETGLSQEEQDALAKALQDKLKPKRTQKPKTKN